MKTTAILMLLLVGFGPMIVQAQWYENGEPVADTDWRKSDGEFGALLLVTGDPNGFVEQWNRPPTEDYRPEMVSVSSVTRGDTVVAFVIFRGCAANRVGNCESSVDFKVLRPDGSLYADGEHGELWTDRPAPPLTYLQLSVANLGFIVEEDDPFGSYRMEAVVRDHVSGRQLELSQSLEVVDETLGSTDAAPAVAAVSELMTYFYTSQSEADFNEVQQGMRAHLDEFAGPDAGASLLSAVFLGRVHAKHGWPLLPLGRLTDQAKSIAAQDDSDLSRYVRDDTQVDPGKLDIWWVSFFATAETKYLDKIIEQVGDLEKQAGVENMLIMGAANWSLASNCQQHPAVLRHAKSWLESDPPTANRKAIERIVTEEKASAN